MKVAPFGQILKNNDILHTKPTMIMNIAINTTAITPTMMYQKTGGNVSDVAGFLGTPGSFVISLNAVAVYSFPSTLTLNLPVSTCR